MHKLITKEKYVEIKESNTAPIIQRKNIHRERIFLPQEKKNREKAMITKLYPSKQKKTNNR